MSFASLTLSFVRSVAFLYDFFRSRNKVDVIIRIKGMGLSQRFWKNEVRRKEGMVGLSDLSEVRIVQLGLGLFPHVSLNTETTALLP